MFNNQPQPKGIDKYFTQGTRENAQMNLAIKAGGILAGLLAGGVQLLKSAQEGRKLFQEVKRLRGK